MSTKQISAEALLALHRRLSTLPPRSHEPRLVMQDTARLYGVSEPTLYRALGARGRPKIMRRADRGTPRVLPQEQLERYCELIAAIKMRTSNKKQRHLSTGETIRLLEEFGLETPEGFVQAPKGRLTRTTVNRTILTEEALARLAERLTTPLQIERHLSRALEEGYKVGQKPVSAELIDTVIAKDIDDLEPRLTRQGYHMKALAELLRAKPAEIRLFLRGQLATGRTQELHSGLLAAGIPL